MGNNVSVAPHAILQRPGHARPLAPQADNGDTKGDADNVHVQVVSGLLRSVYDSAREGDLSTDEIAALKTAIDVLRSRRLQEKIAESGMPSRIGEIATSEYDVKPFYDDVFEQRRAINASLLRSLRRPSDAATTDDHGDDQHDPHSERRSDPDDLAFLQRPSNNPDRKTTPAEVLRQSSSKTVDAADDMLTVDDTLYKEVRKPTIFTRRDAHEAKLIRGVSFTTNRTLRTLSVQGNGAQPSGRGHTGAYQADAFSSILTGSLPAQDFNDFKCYIPRAVLKEIYAFAAQQTEDAKEEENKALKQASDDRNAAPPARSEAVFSATDAYERPYEAAVLFADMSGFTALTERLAARANNDGAELLCAALNKFFGVILDIAEEYGGDCVKFAGDALCILWTVQKPQSKGSRKSKKGRQKQRKNSVVLNDLVDGDNDNPWHNLTTLQHAAVAAATCSTEIHRQLRDFPRAHGVRLTVHMGLGVGKVNMLYVGGKFGRWEFVVSGPPMKQIAIAEPLAGSGETVCSPAAWSVLKRFFNGEPVAEQDYSQYVILGEPHSEAVRQVAETVQAIAESRRQALRKSAANGCADDGIISTSALHLNIGLAKSFIPNAVYQQLAAGYGDNLVAEMRQISVLFVKVSGLSVDGSGALGDMQRMMMAVQESTYLFEGSINKLLIDDKGLLVVIGFGLPPLAHEDDPLRAVAAACEIRHRLSFASNGPHLTTHIGITSGEIFCGVVGNDVRREYTVMGDLVNLSARLMGTAERNSILVDEATAMHCVRHVQFHTVPPLTVKGKVRAIQPFTPDGWFTTCSGADGSSTRTSSSRMMNVPHLLGDDGSDHHRPANLSVAGMIDAKDQDVLMNSFFQHIRDKHLQTRDSDIIAPGGYNGDRDNVKTASHSPGDQRDQTLTRQTVFGRHRDVDKLLNSFATSTNGNILAIIGETGIGKSAFLAKVVAHLDQQQHVVVGVDYGDATGHVQHLPETETGSSPWRTRLTEVGILPSFQMWKSAILQAIAHYLYDHPAELCDRTVIEAYTEAIVKLVPAPLRRYIRLIDELFPELHLGSSKAVARATEGYESSCADLPQSRKVDLRCRILIGMLRSIAPTQTLVVVLDSCRSFDAFSWTLLKMFSQFQTEQKSGGDVNTQAAVNASRDIAASPEPFRPASPAVSDIHQGGSTAHPDLDSIGTNGKVLVVVMSRPISKTSHRYRDFTWMVQRAAQASSLLHLGPLERKYCEDLVFRNMSATRVPTAVLEYTFVHSHGNPLHLIELCRHLVAEQVVFVLNGECRFSSPSSKTAVEQSKFELQSDMLSYPRVLIQNARSRLDHLPPSEQMITKIASVMPRVFCLWQLLSVVNGTHRGRSSSPNASGDSDIVDFDSPAYKSLEQLTLSGILKVLKGHGQEALNQTGDSHFAECYDEYELELPLLPDCVMRFDSATVRACASTLLLSAQKNYIRAHVEERFAPLK